MKKFGFISLVLLLIFILLIFVTTKKNIDIDGTNISVNIPPIFLVGMFKNYDIQLSKKLDNNCYLNLLYSSFDRPLVLLPSNDRNTVFIIYFFDIEDHVFAVELDKEIGKNPVLNMHKSLKRIVLSSNGFRVRYLTGTEVKYVINEIKSMDDDKYEQLSIPTIDIGAYKLYMSKSRVIEMLQKIQTGKESKEWNARI